MCGIEQERDRGVRLTTIGMLRGKAHELIRDPPERIQLKRMFPRSRFEKLIEALLEINRRCARHVIQVVTLAVPRERWPHRRAITRMKEVVRTREILLFGKSRRRIPKVRRVITKEFAAILP